MTVVRSLAWLLLLPLSACAVSIGDRSGYERSDARDDSRRAIHEILDRQAAAWNRGDLDAFMADYWRSPELVFTSGGRVQRGWRTTLDRYRDTYGGSTETMGRLSFHDVTVHPLSRDAAWALGYWDLDRGGEEVGGVFTLVFRRIDGEWKIVHDHTSVSEE